MMTYGDFVICKESDIDNAKKLLLEQMIETIRELAKTDEFWCIKPTSVCNTRDDYTVAWKAEFPFMRSEPPEEGK